MAALQDEINAWFVPSWNNYFGVVKYMTDMLADWLVLIYFLSFVNDLYPSNSAGTLKSGTIYKDDSTQKSNWFFSFYRLRTG